MELKHLIFFIILLIGVPIGVVLASSNRFIEKCAWIAAVSFGFMGNFASINFFSFESYRGTSRGYEVTLVDLAALVLFFVMLLKRGGKITFRIPGFIFYLFYLAFSVISVVNSVNYLYSFAEIWKMFRMLFYFIIIFNYLDWRRDFTTAFLALGGVIALTFLCIIKQKYLNRIYQPPGFFPHQNSMAMYMELLAPVFFAAWMNLKLPVKQMLLLMAVFFLAGGCALLSYSRGAFLFFPLGCGVVALFTLYFNFQQRQIKILLVLCTAGMLGLLLMLPSIILRFKTAPEASKNTRINLAIAARNMANDKFFGVGINNWGIKINPPYTYSEHRIGNRYNDDFKDGLVETIYLMVAAECGWIGFASLFLMFAYFGFLSFGLVLYYSKSTLFFIPLGFMGGFMSIFGHSTLEWVLKQTPNFYILVFAFSVVSVLAVWRKREKQEVAKQRKILRQRMRNVSSSALSDNGSPGH